MLVQYKCTAAVVVDSSACAAAAGKCSLHSVPYVIPPAVKCFCKSVFARPIFPFEITYLNSDAQWGGLLVKELHIEPQQPNLAKGEKSAAHETQAFDCRDSRKTHNQTRALKGQAHAHTRTHAYPNTRAHGPCHKGLESH